MNATNVNAMLKAIALMIRTRMETMIIVALEAVIFVKKESSYNGITTSAEGFQVEVFRVNHQPPNSVIL